jgi:ABC-type nitrate/sulfonate/bicarbonate transport system permease component
MKLLKGLFFSLLATTLIGIIFYLLLLYKHHDSNTGAYGDESLKESWVTVLLSIKSTMMNGSSISLLAATGNTMIHFFISFLLAAISGVAIGVSMGTYRGFGRRSNYLLNFFRVLPSIVFITVFKYQFKMIESYVYWVGILASVWPIIINTKAGVEKVNLTLRETIMMLNIPPGKKLFQFTLPEAFPDIFNGIKTSMGISFLIAITCEYLYKELRGLGSLLSFYEMDCAACIAHSMFVILIIGFCGVVLNFLIELMEKKIPWLTHQFSTDE